MAGWHLCSIPPYALVLPKWLVRQMKNVRDAENVMIPMICSELLEIAYIELVIGKKGRTSIR